VKVDPSDFATCVRFGEATTPVTLAKRIAVAGCYECPFNYDGIDCKIAMAHPDVPDGHGLSITENRNRSDVPEGGRPDWCPLELGAVTVEVDRG